MKKSNQFNYVFLGGGSTDPRVVMFKMTSQGNSMLIRLPILGSVYAMDFNLESSTLAAGTKEGFVYITGVDLNRCQQEVPPCHKILQGAPVLSICWVNDSVLAVSDTAGRCLLWHRDNQSPLRKLETSGGAICSLRMINDETLAGFSTKGTLYFWHVVQGHLIETVDIPCPPPYSALVKMEYWKSEDKLVFPAAEGYMTFYYIEKEELKKIKAHNSEFYATALCGDILLTAGLNDCRLKTWQAGSEKPTCSHHVPEGIISISGIGMQPDKFVSVDKNGRAWLYKLGDDALHLEKPVEDQDYRSVISLEPVRILKFCEEKSKKEVYELVAKTKENSGRIKAGDSNMLHSRLKQLGFEHVSLAIRSEQALENGNIVESLKYSSSLIKLLPQDDIRSCQSLEHHANLLYKNWHIIEVDEICKKIISINPDHAFSIEAERIKNFSDCLKNKSCIIDPDITVEQIIKAASIIKKTFNGRYLLVKHNPKHCPHLKITPEMVAGKYEEVKKDQSRSCLPSASAEQVFRISRSGIDEISLIAFGDGMTSQAKGLQFALHVSESEHGSLITPLIIFDCRKVVSGGVFSEGNREACKILHDLQTNSSTNSYIADIHETALFAIKRLITENMSKKRSQP